ncbi:MAG: permease-like cell division protein FtsX, partial [Gallionella sp.]
MSHALTQIASVTHRMFASKLAGMLSVLVIGIALSLPAGMYMLLQNAQGLLDQFSGTPQLSLFLKRDAKSDDIDKLRKQLSQHPGVERYEFVSRQQALEQLKQSAGLSEVIGGLKQNPLPDAFIIYPKSGEATTLEALRSELAGISAVD